MGEALIVRRGGGNAEIEYHTAVASSSYAAKITLDTNKNYRVFVVDTYDINSASSTGGTRGYYTGTIQAGAGLTAERYEYAETSTSKLIPTYNKTTGVLTLPATGNSFYCCRVYVMEIS